MTDGNMKEVLLDIEIEKLPEGVFLATSKDLPGLVVQASRIAEVVDIAQDAAQKLIESYREHGDPLPPALRKKTVGGAPVAIKPSQIAGQQVMSCDLTHRLTWNRS